MDMGESMGVTDETWYQLLRMPCGIGPRLEADGLCEWVERGRGIVPRQKRSRERQTDGRKVIGWGIDFWDARREKND